MKDKTSHKSKGVAFIMYLERDSLYKAVNALNNKEVSILSLIVLVTNSTPVQVKRFFILFVE